jgi:lipoprotein signal peptidase
VGARLLLSSLVFGLVVDLGTKVVAVQVDHGDGWLVYNAKATPGLVHRSVMSLVAIGACVALARLARWRGMGEIWGAWIGCGLLVAGIMGNGVSALIWSRGVPDFIHAGDRWIWNVADFAIGVGLVGGIVSIALTGLGVWVRELAAR